MPRHVRFSRGRGALLVVSFLVALSVGHFLVPDGWPGLTSYLAVTVGASIAAWVSVRRRGGVVRVWLALGISASALGDILFQIDVAVRHTSPDISIADVPWIASYIGVCIAILLTLRRGGRGSRGDVDGMIDMAVIALVAVLLLWQFWLNTTLSDSSEPVFVRGVWAIYPILDATMLSIAIRALIERRTARVTAGFLFGGVSCWLASDFGFLIMSLPGWIAKLLDIGWMVGAALLAAACWRIPSADHSTATRARSHASVGKGRVALGIAPFFVPGLIELFAYVRGRDVNPVPMLLATAAFAALAGSRALRLLAVRDRAQARLASSERRYRALAANSSDAVFLLDAEGRIISDASTLAEMLGYPGRVTLGQRALDFVSASDVESQQLLNECVVAPGVVFSGETRIARPEARDLWLATRAVNLLHDPDVRGIVVNVHDITARKEAEEELVHRAFHDSLTGLANRALFRDRVEHALTRGARSGFDPAVIYLDLDGFKHVNDSLGHEAGDALLHEVAMRLQGVVRSGDTVARLGGDEFGVLIDESAHVHVEAEQIADRALEVLSAPVMIGKEKVTVAASLGIAYADADATASSLLRDADVAMYQAKSAGKGRWVVYEPVMRAAAVERLRLENDLAEAAAHERLHLVYQPVIELESNQVVGFEALLRWDHPQLGPIAPDKFIPIAEENGSIVAIGRWVLRHACLVAAEWQERFDDRLTIAVNVSGRQLESPGIFEDVREALAISHLDPSTLVLEVTETALVADTELAAAKMHELRSLGVRLAIDDFGTGYSSLAYLRQFPIDVLKIDGSFVQTITNRSEVSPIVRGLIELGRTLDLEIIAEGIESGAQLEQLRDEQCHLGQGYLFARPLRDEDVEGFIRDLLEASTVPCRPRH